MIPSRFLVLPALPLTPNGKLDRKALEKLGGKELTTGTEHVAARTQLECELAGIWQAVLRREQVGINDNFFDLGGHSLLAVAMCSQITRRLGVDVPLRWLFEHPTIAGLAGRIETLDRNFPSIRPIGKADRCQALPVSFSQQGMWLLQQTLPDAATYNVPVFHHLHGTVAVKRLRECLQTVMSRHEVLRTALVLQGEDLAQQIGAAQDVPPPWLEVDLQGVPASRQQVVLEECLLEEARRPFDLARGGASFHRIPGSHLEIFSPEHLPALADSFRLVLHRAQENDRATRPPPPPRA